MAVAARTAEMLDRSSEGCLLLDRRGRLVYANRAARTLLPAAEAAGGKPLWGRLPPPLGGLLAARSRRAAGTGKPARLELRGSRPNSWLEVRLHPSSQGLAILLRDTTLLHHARRRARQWQARAAALSQRQAELRRRLAHALHEQALQLLFGARLGLGAMERSKSKRTRRDALVRVERLISQAMESVRAVAVELQHPAGSPPPGFGNGSDPSARASAGPPDTTALPGAV